MAENYNRCLNIQVVGLAEDTETGQPVEIFESLLPRILKMTTKASCIMLERASRIQTGTEQDPQVVAAVVPYVQG